MILPPCPLFSCKGPLEWSHETVEGQHLAADRRMPQGQQAGYLRFAMRRAYETPDAHRVIGAYFVHVHGYPEADVDRVLADPAHPLTIPEIRRSLDAMPVDRARHARLKHLCSKPLARDPLDFEYDGVTLRELLDQDEIDRRENCPKALGRAWTPMQRAVVSAHWSAELRAKVAADKERERTRVVLDCAEDL